MVINGSKNGTFKSVVSVYFICAFETALFLYMKKYKMYMSPFLLEARKDSQNTRIKEKMTSRCTFLK